MPTRYQQLRQAVARLAASADEQDAYRERILGQFGSGHGNDELALELEDIFLAANDMHAWDEITPQEIESVRPLDQLLGQLSGKQHSDFWHRGALWDDPRWEEVRACARRALDALPDEERPSEWLKHAVPPRPDRRAE